MNVEEMKQQHRSDTLTDKRTDIRFCTEKIISQKLLRNVFLLATNSKLRA